MVVKLGKLQGTYTTVQYTYNHVADRHFRAYRIVSLISV